jgi:hypothetical protein
MATPFGHNRITDFDGSVWEWRTEVATACYERCGVVVRRAANGVPNIPAGGRFSPFDESIEEIRDGVPVVFARRPAREDDGADQFGETSPIFKLGSEMIDRRGDQIEAGCPQTNVFDSHNVNHPDFCRRVGVALGFGACVAPYPFEI